MKTTTIEFDLDDGDAVLLAGAADLLGMTLSGYMNHVLLLEIMRTQREEIESLRKAVSEKPKSFQQVVDYDNVLGIYWDDEMDSYVPYWVRDDEESPFEWQPVFMRDNR